MAGVAFWASVASPGGNVTGLTLFNIAVTGKRLELLLELVSAAAVIGLLVHPGAPTIAENEVRSVQSAAAVLGRQVRILSASNEAQIEEAFAAAAQQRIAALIISGDAFFTNRRNQVATLAAHYTIPTIYAWREYVAAGGLLSYGNSFQCARRPRTSISTPVGIFRFVFGQVKRRHATVISRVSLIRKVPRRTATPARSAQSQRRPRLRQAQRR